MTLRRIATAFAAVIVSLGLAFTLTPGAAQAAKASHRGYANASEIRNTGTFRVAGRFYTAYVNQPVFLQRQPRSGGTWRNVKSTRIQSDKRFYMRFDGPTNTCYRVLLRETPRYRAATRKIGCIVAG